jgi:hypothetical protein
MKKNSSSRVWFIVGLLSAATVGAFANLPSTGDSSGSMAPTQDVSEIKAGRHADLSFDQDLKHLAAVQGRYRENLPLSKRKVTPRLASAKVAKKAKAAPKKKASLPAKGRG